jgi:hypothetical protein
VPLDADGQPEIAEPLGDLAALYGAALEKDVRAVYTRGGLQSYRSILDSPFIAVPYDVILPGVLRSGDLSNVAEALRPRALKLEDTVDGLNRRVKGSDPIGPSRWLLEQLKN